MVVQAEVLPQLASRGGLGTIRSLPDVYENQTVWRVFKGLNVLSQVRKTYEAIEELGDDIARKGMMHPVQVAWFSVAETERYIAKVNMAFKANHRLEDLTPAKSPTGQSGYEVVITGHRRNLGHRYLWHHGCSDCIENYGQEAPGTCYARHPRLKAGCLVEVKLYPHITSTAALAMQCTENIHKTVPSAEQAEAYDALYITLQLDDPELTVTQFARMMSCDPDTIRRARLYCRLPLRIREHVEAGRLTYGVAIELGRRVERLQENPDFLEAECEVAITERPTLQEARRDSNRLISKAQVGEVSMFSLGSLAEGAHQRRRQVFEQRVVLTLHTLVSYFCRVKPLLEDGTMSRSGEYLNTSTRGLVGDTLDLIEVLLPDLRLSRDALRDQAIVAEARELLVEINQLARLVS